MKLNILTIGNYNSPLATYEAQIKQFIIMYKRGYNIIVQGHFSQEIESLLKANNIPLIYDKPNNKKDLEFCDRLKNYTTQNEINIVHVFGGANTANVSFALKKTNIKIIGYMGSTSIHWHDPSAYKTYLNPRINAIICNSKSNATHFKKQLWGNSKNKVHTIYKGYGVEWFDQIKEADLSEYGIPNDALIVCSVGNRRKVKAMDLLIKSIEHVKLNSTTEVHYILVGDSTDDDYMTNLKRKSKQAKNIHLLGFKSNVKEIIKKSDIYIQTSKKEGLGRAITESMCLKKPIIVTNAGGCTELVEDKVSGYIAKNNNIYSIAEKISLLINDVDKREKFGKESYKRVQTIFNIDKTVSETLKLYQNLIENKQNIYVK